MSLHPEAGGAPSADWTLPDELRMLAEMGDADTVREVIAVFQTDTRARLSVIQKAVADGDVGKLKSEAHAVKGSAAQVGATTVSNLCRYIELAAGNHDLQTAARLMPDLESAFAAVCRAMSKVDIQEP